MIEPTFTDWFTKIVGWSLLVCAAVFVAWFVLGMLTGGFADEDDNWDEL